MLNFYRYNIFNFTLYSEFPLQNIVSDNTQQAFKLYVKKFRYKPEFQEIIYSHSRIQISQIGFIFTPLDLLFYYDHLQQTIYTNPSNNYLFEPYLLGPVMSLTACYFNQLPLHAAGVTLNKCNMLIMGNSGSGKSTFLYYLMQNYKARYISDDMVLLKPTSLGIEAIPSYPELKLWNDVILQLQAEPIKAVHPQINKFYVTDHQLFYDKSVKPHILVFLQTTTQQRFSIEEVKGARKWALLQANIFRKPWIEHTFKQLMFDYISTLSNQCRAYVITRPINFKLESWEKHIHDFMKKLL